MAELSYGQFFDAFEDAACPLVESHEEEPPLKAQKTKSWLATQSPLLAKVFRALEVVNHGQLEVYDSSLSLASSYASMTSLNSERSVPESAFGVFQSILIPNINDSTTSLSGLDSTGIEEKINPVLIPMVIKNVLFAFEEFMHNHTHLEEGSAARDGASGLEFPKFC
mmetsp:Transcript_29272/g.49281  ORF Transcript_29272/g.49281 Transcript_29272/m.49281 type:complete len:167 (-) Transcript_29272:1105-1605(-)